MKILLVTSSFRGGGITSYAHEVVNCFSKGNDMSVIIGDDTQLPFDRSKVNVYNLESTDFSETNAKELVRLINHEICPDVVLNSNSALMSLVTPYINDDIRIISVSHSLRYNEADTAGLNSEYADGLIALSSYNKDYLCRQFRIEDRNKVSVIYNFVEELSNAKDVREEKKKNKKLKIVFAGGTSAAKSPELVYNVMQGLLKTSVDFEFYFMGANSPTLQTVQRYKSLQELFKPDSRIIFTDRIPRKQAESLIGSANIFLVPSRREGCPMAMIEAMRVGCIIITSDFKNACQEMVEDSVNGYIIPHNNVQAFVDRITDIIKHHDKYLSMYDACYTNYCEKFSFSPWQKQMTNVIETKVLNHKKRTSELITKQYNKDLKWLIRRQKYNKIHMLIFETLKSAIPFFIYNLKK